MSSDELITRIEELFGPVPDNVKRSLAAFDEEQLEALGDELKLRKSLEDVELYISQMETFALGRLEGMRYAIQLVLGIRNNELAEEIGAQASRCYDFPELEELLLKAIRSGSETSLN